MGINSKTPSSSQSVGIAKSGMASCRIKKLSNHAYATIFGNVDCCSIVFHCLRFIKVQPGKSLEEILNILSAMLVGKLKPMEEEIS